MASYRVLIKPSAVKELEAIPKKDRQRLSKRIQNLAIQPRSVGAERLTGQEWFRVRQGDFRIVYAIDDKGKVVMVFKVGHRRDVYR